MARQAGNQKVRGSTPLRGTRINNSQNHD